MQTEHQNLYRYFIAVAVGAMSLVAWLSVCSLLVVQGTVPASLETVLARCGNFCASLLIGFVSYNKGKSIWSALCCVGGFLLMVAIVSFVCNGLDSASFLKSILASLGGFFLAVLLKNRKKGKKRNRNGYSRGKTKK